MKSMAGRRCLVSLVAICSFDSHRIPARVSSYSLGSSTHLTYYMRSAIPICDGSDRGSLGDPLNSFVPGFRNRGSRESVGISSVKLTVIRSVTLPKENKSF
jgi:hypothetical protein